VTISVITPSFNQLDWLRLCVSSVRDQVDGVANDEFRVPSGEIKADDELRMASNDVENPLPATGHTSPIVVEHIIQDAGTAGIEDFAREIGADFFRNGQLIFSFSESQHSSISRYRIAVHCEADAGMYDAINRGLKKATGEFLSYLNCDEQYLPMALQSVAAWFLDNPDRDVLFADAVLLDDSGKALSYRRTVLPDKLHTRLCHLNTLTCSTFFRRSVIDRGHIFPERKKIIGDGVWVYGMLEAGVSMGNMKQPTSVFTFTGSNMSEIDKGTGSEQDMWLNEPGAPPRWLRMPVSLFHRLKKMANGAYQQRTFDYAVFTLDSTQDRRAFKAHRLGALWPGDSK